jgi:two-component system, NtrC family, sensor kinase
MNKSHSITNNKPVILIVDDELVNLEFITELLERNNYKVDSATSGEVALEKVRASLPDLILLDIEMGGIDGFEVCLRLKADVKTKDIPVIFISGVYRFSDKIRAFDSGGVDFISKPFDSREVFVRIRTHLKIMQLQNNLKEKTHALNEQVIASKKLESISRAAEKEMQALIGFLPIGILITTPDGQILKANPELLDIFGFSSFEEISQFKITALYLKKRDRGFFLEQIKKGRVENFETRFKKNNGEVIWCSVSSVSQKDNEGRTFFINSFQNITEKKKMEKEKARLLIQLTQADKMVSVGRLAAGVAHEINNPLSFVSSNLNSLKGYLSDINSLLSLNKKFLTRFQITEVSNNIFQAKKEIESFCQEIEFDFIQNDIDDLMKDCNKGLDRIKSIVGGLKDFSQPGKTERCLVDINTGIESTLNVATNELQYKTVIIKELGEIRPIMAVAQQINQVFLNILINAVQSIDKTGEIIIKTWYEAGYNHITISDTGCGISQENIKKVFDPFFTTREIGEGTGLGMNIAYNIIKEHKGSITVKSKINQGTSFEIKLPAIENNV